MEQCVGCGAKSRRHPIVGVAARGDVEGDRIGEREGYVAHPVCERCWREPTTRKVQGLKMHYFERNRMDDALAAAGSDSIG
jgi:thymidine kinase